jgi:hypothetical protein
MSTQSLQPSLRMVKFGELVMNANLVESDLAPKSRLKSPPKSASCWRRFRAR